MSVLSVANKIFKDISYSVTKDGSLKVRMSTPDTKFFKHDLNCINQSDPILLDAFLRNYAYTLNIDSVEFDSFYPISIRKSRIKGKRIVTFKKYIKKVKPWII